MARSRALARKRLENQLELLHPLRAIQRPVKGWVRAIRDALGMSSSELARRMRVSQQAISDLEHNELNETIKLATLRRAADALECDLVYGLVPRAPLDTAVLAQARRRAAGHLRMVAHHSRLEDQTVSDADTSAQLDELTAHFVDQRGLWTDPADE